MKKVFSKEKWIRDFFGRDILNIDGKKIEELIINLGWVNICDGLTEDEMNKLGYKTHDDWMIEVEE